MAALEAEHWWFVSRGAIIKALIERIVSPEPGWRILDAGCGTGGNLRILSQFGQVLGVESDREAARISSQKGIATVLQSRIPHFPFKKESFELVTLFDVIEHLDDDVGCMKAAADLMKPGGVVLVTVPAFSFLWSDHDRMHHHRRRYTVKEIEKLINNAGLKVKYSSYINFLLFPLIATVRLCKERLGIGRRADDHKMPGSLLNSLLRFLFSLERIVIGRLSVNFGVSIISCGQKL
jgi:SAM-dependent methyltransferase